tara:strand:+ start:219 stop:431 length:213 start_codon:yes stop_codon:yes gene_type:complete
MHANSSAGFNPFYFSIVEASNLCGISTDTIQREVKANRYPPKHQISKKRIAFRRDDVFLWLEGKRNWGLK